jgi:hypothetical protein
MPSLRADEALPRSPTAWSDRVAELLGASERSPAEADSETETPFDCVQVSYLRRPGRSSSKRSLARDQRDHYRRGSGSTPHDRRRFPLRSSSSG